MLPITWLCARRRHAATQGKLLEVSHLTRGGHGQQAPGRIGVAKRLASHGEVAKHGNFTRLASHGLPHTVADGCPRFRRLHAWAGGRGGGWASGWGGY